MADELISRQALMRNFCGYDLNECVKYGNKTAEQQNNSYSTMMMYEIANEIEDAPAVEAVEVGSCDGCIYSHRKRPQKCSCCRRNRDLKDCYERRAENAAD